MTVERAGSVRALVKLEGVHKSPKGRESVSYTHLDVYKRQATDCPLKDFLK